jgi:threonine dehydratase
VTASRQALPLSESVLADARRADERIRPHARETPLVPASSLRGASLKLETLQVTGSFKFRGAMNKLLSLPETDRARGVVAASTGNHGAATSSAGEVLGVPVHVFVPESIAAPKLDRMVASGARIKRVPGDPLEAERTARRYAEREGIPYISPYNDAAIIAGQATIGLELVRQYADPPDAIFVPLGGGGLSSGVAIAVKAAWPDTRVIACSPSNSAVMIRSIEAGRILDVASQPTLSDGTAGGVDPETITFDLCREWIDEFVIVSEDEIADALRLIVGEERIVIEGAAAVAVAGYHKLSPASAIIVLSGANIATETLIRVFEEPTF